ncbi:MAG: histidine--tRNA ligase [Nitrososphaerota archaeon]|nr:histidine--tRNA ligase [Nitrososphaerota archaeon]MDG7039518.1 histidine--tRNA ligase [Nitrososphaerota archaeon]
MDLVRGLRDYDPDTFERLEIIRRTFTDNCRLYGIRLMEPSSLELLDTLKAKSGDEVTDEIYAFTDKGGRQLGLRFDLTVGITRFVCSRRDMPLPVKLGSFSSMWRYDEPQRGRYRWFYQWDVEVFGARDRLLSNTEVIAFTASMLRDLGIRDYVIKVGDRRLLDHALKAFDDRKRSYMFGLIDKMAKKEEAELVDEYLHRGLSEDEIKYAFEIGRIEGDIGRIESITGQGTADELASISSKLKEVGVKHEVSMQVVRGLDYYTGVVFEAFDEFNPSLHALAGGGEFDRLPAVFGRPELSALGVAGGADRLLLAMKKETEEKGGVYVAYAKEMGNEAMKLAEELREARLAVRIDLDGHALSRQLADAERLGTVVTVMVLPEEWEKGYVKLKVMSSRSETIVRSDETLEALRKALNETV